MSAIFAVAAVAAASSARRRHGGGGPYGPSSGSGKGFSIGCLVFVAALVALFWWIISIDTQRAMGVKHEWQAFAQRNPQVEIVAVSQGQYGPDKWHQGQIIVEIKGTQTDETRVIREKDDHVKFNHVPVAGEIWRTWVTEPQGKDGTEFKFHMEPRDR